MDPQPLPAKTGGRLDAARAAYGLAVLGAALMVVLVAYAHLHMPQTRPATRPGAHGLEWVAGPLETPLAVASLVALAAGVFAAAVHATTRKGEPRRYVPLTVSIGVLVATLGIGCVAYVFVEVMALGM